MKVESNKYRKKKKNQASALTVESGDSLLVNSGGTMTLASGATVAMTAPTITNPIYKQTYINATATKVLVAADSGAMVTLGTAGGFDTKLPAPAVGLNFRIIVKVAPTTNYTVTTDGSTQNVIHGGVMQGGVITIGDKTAGTAVDVITFAANKAAIGDYVELTCDGTLWYCVAFASLFDAITFD